MSDTFPHTNIYLYTHIHPPTHTPCLRSVWSSRTEGRGQRLPSTPAWLAVPHWCSGLLGRLEGRCEAGRCWLRLHPIQRPPPPVAPGQSGATGWSKEWWRTPAASGGTGSQSEAPKRSNSHSVGGWSEETPPPGTGGMRGGPQRGGSAGCCGGGASSGRRGCWRRREETWGNGVEVRSRSHRSGASWSPEGLGVDVGQPGVVAELQFAHFWKVLESRLLHHHQLLQVIQTEARRTKTATTSETNLIHKEDGPSLDQRPEPAAALKWNFSLFAYKTDVFTRFYWHI